MSPHFHPIHTGPSLLACILALGGCDSEREDGSQQQQLDLSEQEDVDQERELAPVYRANDDSSASRAPSSFTSRTGSKRFIVVLEEEEVAGRSTDAMLPRFSLARTESTFDGPFMHAFTAELSEDELQEVRQFPEVAYIEEEQVFTASAPTSLWGLDRIDQPNLPLNGDFTASGDGNGVEAYIVDSGIRSSHVEFAGRIGPGFDAVGGGTGDCSGHGTHVAGTVGGSTFGVAPNVTLHPVRVLNCAGAGSTSGILNALNWIGQNATLPAVVNMSLGGGPSFALDQAISNLSATGVTVVVAAGNENQNACNVSPARASAAITVGSTTINDFRSGFSNWGTCVDVSAPGSGIRSAGVSSNTAISTQSGTSMASPHVAGIAALFLQANPDASPAEVADAIIENATVGVLANTNGSPNLLVNTDFLAE